MKTTISAKFIAENNSFAVIEAVWDDVSIYDGHAKYKEDLSRYSEPQRLLHACHWYISEVNNGGHHQFYSNSTGIVWAEALHGFRVAGLQEVAEILEESVTRMGGAPSFDREERQRTLEELDPDFEDLDDRFYKVERQVSLEDALTDYMRKHAKSFELPRRRNDGDA
jgi:hypothetical protein